MDVELQDLGSFGSGDVISEFKIRDVLISASMDEK